MWRHLKRRQGFVFVLLLLTSAIFTSKTVGWLQPFEWMIFDRFMQVRPKEPIDQRIVIVALTQNDIESLKQYPISDRNLAAVLNKVKQQKPIAIGLDIYRDVPVCIGHDELVKVFKTTPNLIGIKKVLPPDPVKAPPVLEELGQVSTSDSVVDGDRKVRRTLLYPTAEGSENIPNLGLALAFEYLDKQGITPKSAPDKSMQLKNTTFPLLRGNDGGYSNLYIDNYQILTNYRGSAGSFTTVSFSDVLANRVPPNLMKNRIVIVGNTAENVKDLFFTPFSNNLESTPEQTSGAELHANTASQIISAVLDNRPLFKFLPDQYEDIIVWLLPISALLLIWKVKPNSNQDFSVIFIGKVFLVSIVFATAIVSFSYIAFLNSFWIPVFLPLAYLVIYSLAVTGYIYLDQIKLTNILLEQKNRDLQAAQRELEAYNATLEASNVALEASNVALEEKTSALQESETRLILALDAARTAIWDWDLIEDEICILRNCSYLLGWGNDSERISFDTFLTECVCEENRMLLGEEVTSIINDVQDCEFEFPVKRQYDNVRWLAVKGKVYYDSPNAQATRMLGVLSDITERKTSEKKAVLLEGKYNALTTNSFETTILIEENLDICYLPPSLALKRILGYLNEEIYGKNIVDLVHPQDVSLFIQAMGKIFTLPDSITQVECKWLHSDGSWHILESIIYNCLENPSIRAFVINSRDVTEYNQMKKALQDLENSGQ